MEQRGAEVQRHHNFTDHEVDVLTRIALGQSAPDIARELQTPVPEINIVIALICSMLGVDGRGAAIGEGFRRGIISRDSVERVRTARRRSRATTASWFGVRSVGDAIER